MALFQVYSEPHIIRHYSTVCSRALLFQIIVYGIVIVVPFFFCHGTNEFWQYSSTYTEQPDVNFLNEWIVQIANSSSPSAATWSTFAGLNRLLQPSEIAIPVVIFYEDDWNFDGIRDRLTVEMEFPDDHLAVSGVQALLFFQVELRAFSTVVMQSLLYVSASWSSPSTQLLVIGDLTLHQQSPLPASGTVTTYNTSLFNDSSLLAKDYQITSIMDRYHERNITTVITNSYNVWQSGSAGKFVVKFQINYPWQTITYTPGFWQVVKLAWVQYLAVMVIFLYALHWVQGFVFHNQIILTVRQHPTEKCHTS